MSIGRQDYEERREARADRLEERAQKAAGKAADAFRRSEDAVRGIPAGQPILPGARGIPQRKAQERSWKLMGASVENDRKAENLQRRAEAVRGNTAISSDDPEAVEKLEAKLKALQAAQESDKALNAYYRKHKTVKGFPGISDAQATKVDARLAELREALRRPIPAFQLSNRNAEINRLKSAFSSSRRWTRWSTSRFPSPGGS